LHRGHRLHHLGPECVRIGDGLPDHLGHRHAHHLCAGEVGPGAGDRVDRGLRGGDGLLIELDPAVVLRVVQHRHAGAGPGLVELGRQGVHRRVERWLGFRQHAELKVPADLGVAH